MPTLNISNILLILSEMAKQRAIEKIHAATKFKTDFTGRGGGPKASMHSPATHWKFEAYYCERKSALKTEGFVYYTLYKYRKVYKASQGKDEACLEVDQEVSFGREGG